MDAPDQGKMQAASDLADIIELQRSKGFHRYFLREARDEIGKLTKALTEDELPEPQTRKKQGELKVWRRIVAKLDADFSVNHDILNTGEEDATTRAALPAPPASS